MTNTNTNNTNAFVDPLDWEVGDTIQQNTDTGMAKFEIVALDGDFTKFKPVNKSAFDFVKMIDEIEDDDGIPENERTWDKKEGTFWQQNEGMHEDPFTLIKKDGRRARYNPDTYWDE